MPLSPRAAPTTAPVATVASSGRPEIALQTAPGGSITVRSSSGTPVATGVTTSELSPAETAALLSRLEPLPVLGDQSAAPPLRPPSAPPQRTAPAQPIAFVAPQGKAVTHAPIAPRAVVAPLVPPQISPEGKIANDAEVRIRFDEPMVPVARVGTVAIPPAAIAPSIAGTWRWIDTRVLQFTVDQGQFARATAYTVTVPAGVRAVSGATLREPQVAKFETPPLALAGVWPHRVRPDSPLVVQLDQAFDADAIAPLLRVLDAKQRPLAWKRIDLATARAAWRKNPSLVVDDRVLARPHLVIAPVTAWPAGSEAQLQLLPNAPSREGPLKSVRETFQRFDVVGPMRLVGVFCDYDQKPRRHGTRCPAGGSLGVEMSNEILESSYRSNKIQIAGQPFEDQRPSGDRVYLTAPEKVGATFSVAIADGIMDRHGQPLVGPRDASFRTLPRRQYATLDASSEGLNVLDPRFTTPQWRVMAQSVVAIRVQLYRVQPTDYFAFADYEAGQRATPPGKLVLDKSYPVGARYHAQLDVDLRPALATSGLGHVVAVASASPAAPATGRLERLSTWLQVTKLGLDARLDREKLGAYLVDISPSQSLSPIAGAEIAIAVQGRAAAPAQTTDAVGFATLPLALPSTRDAQSLVVARTPNGDTTFVAVDAFARTVRRQRALWYVTDDRFTYKPGETVYVKGWVRTTHDGVNPGLAFPAAGQRVSYRLEDARGNKLGAGAVAFTAQGGFDIELALPPNANLGTAYFSLSTEHGSHRHPIAIQEFRTPAFAVDLNDDVSHAGATPLVVGESLEMSVAARYYAGGGLGGARVDWRAELTESTYRPPGWDAFAFTPVRDPDAPRRASTSVHQTGALSGASTANVVWGLTALPAGQPSILEVDSVVTDVDRTSIRASSRAIVVHPSNYYVGLRLRPDDTLQVIVTDIDGNAVRGIPVDVHITGVLRSEDGRTDAIVQDRQHCRPTSTDAPVACAWQRKPALSYTAVATVKDARGRANTASYEFPTWFRREAKPSGFTVVPDANLYKAGDTAKLTIHTDVVPATAIVSTARNGIVHQRRIALAQPATLVELPIEPSFVQNVHVVVDRIHADPRTKLPRRESRDLELLVDRESLRLATRVRAVSSLVEPGAMATFEIDVAHGDRPQVGAEVALMVVDEAVLSLSLQQFADPLEPFYRRYEARTSSASTLPLVEDAGDRLHAKPGFERFELDGFGVSGFGPGGGGTGWGTIGSGSYGTIGRGGGNGIVTARKDFRANAVFSPKLVTGPDGKARVEVKMPDSLTRFRIVALATAQTYRFGKAENTIVTQRKINARTVAPRFLTQGDTFSLPVVVQNLDRTPRTIDVAVRAANLRATGPAGKRVTIPAGQRAEVRFDFATQMRGKAVVQTIAVSNRFADATTVELPIYEPATTESFATYGVVDGPAPHFEQLAVPKAIFPEVGSVEVELASTQLASLTDAFYYVYSYPYECAEQRSSRMIATAALGDILVAFGSRSRPTKQLLDDTRARDVRAFGKTQLSDGGWGYFGGMRSNPFVTMQVLTALTSQKATGPVVRKATAYVERQATALLARLDKAVTRTPAERTDRDEYPYAVGLAATALAALATTGADVTARASRLHATATTLEAYPIDAKARLLSLVARRGPKPMRDALLAALVHATHQTASSATVTARYAPSERLLLVSNTRSTALALDALMRERPDHPLVPKLARGVLDGRKHGRWSSTQDNLVALQTMRRYFDTYEKAAPKFAGKLWFGSAAYAERAFEGHSTTTAIASIGWPALGAGTTHDLALVKEGTGRMYYRIGITYAPKQVDLPALDAGFVVRRTYTALEQPSDVVATPTGYRIKLGAKVLVTIEALNTTRRFNVAVVDPLPAGFESVNESLANAERAARVTNDDWDHTALRDHRSEAFAMDMREGSHRFAYTVRATTPGTFLAAPAKAEEMYSPETFGRSAGFQVVVE